MVTNKKEIENIICWLRKLEMYITKITIDDRSQEKCQRDSNICFSQFLKTPNIK